MNSKLSQFNWNNMKKFYLFIILIVAFFYMPMTAQTLLTSQFLGSRSKQQLTSQIPFLTFKNGVKLYKITYETPDVLGNNSVASGLLVVPDDLTKIYPMLCYQHGTSSSKTDVPSAQNGEAQLPIILAGMGYMTIAPDYLGLGDSPGFHPYVHAQTEASVGLDGLRAARDFAADNDLHLNDQVFLTGYSQGGHSSMALHKSLEEDHADEFSVKAAAHLSGPYNISGVMRGLLLNDQPYGNPAYLVNTLFSYQYVYGNLYSNIADAVKPDYINMVQLYYNGDISLYALNDSLLNKLTINEGAAIPIKMFNDDYVAAIETDPNHPANIAMRTNDLFNWNATAPTRLFYCTADEQVPYLNSIIARDSMQAAGSVEVVSTDVNANASHTGCVTPALFNTILFFANYQSITDAPVSNVVEVGNLYQVFPIPANEFLVVKGLTAYGQASIVDLQGRVQLEQEIANGDNIIPINKLKDGIYILDITSGLESSRSKIIVLHQ